MYFTDSRRNTLKNYCI